MAEKAKRCWYQYSLKALLILMVVASLPLGAHVAWRQYLVAKRLAEIERAFQWLESLDPPDMPNCQPVLVAMGYRSSDGDRTPTDAGGLAFLLSEDARSFTILTPSLEHKTIERVETLGDGFSFETSFERTSLRTAVQTSLTTQTGILYRDRYDDYGDVLGERGQLLVMAWACARHGYGEWAIELYNAAEEADKSRELMKSMPGHDAGAASFLDRVAADFAYSGTRRATRDCGSDEPRAEVLKRFRWIKDHFPDSQCAAAVSEKIATLERMIAEDEAHAEKRAAVLPFDELTQTEQIEELIYRLRDHAPSYGCYPDLNDPSKPFAQICRYGYEAIPQLAVALGDKTLARSVERELGSDSPVGYRVRTIGEIAHTLLGHIAGRGFDLGEPIWDQSARVAAMQDPTRIEARQKAALEWYEQLATKGERACILEAIRAGGPHCVSLAHHLAPKEPDAVCEALLEAAGKADEEDQFSFTSAFRWIRSDKSAPYLIDQLAHKKLANRLEAVEALKQLGRPEGVLAMTEQWLRGESVAELSYVGSILVGSCQPEAIRAVAKRFSEQSVEQRSGSMHQAGLNIYPKGAISDDARDAMIELLLVALNDTELRPEPGGAWAGPSIKGLRICDMAGYHLNQLEPERFPFDIGVALVQRERARERILSSVQNR